MRDLNLDDLDAILHWYSKAFANDSTIGEQYKHTLIKIQAMAIYAQEEDERYSNLQRRRMR